MSETTDRPERPVEGDVAACRGGDAARSLDQLRADASAPAAVVADDVAACTALGSETRYAIARLLAEADGELCVCEISPAVDVGESAVSHALADLREAGLVERRKEGSWRYYETTERAERLLAALAAAREEDR